MSTIPPLANPEPLTLPGATPLLPVGASDPPALAWLFPAPRPPRNGFGAPASCPESSPGASPFPVPGAALWGHVSLQLPGPSTQERRSSFPASTPLPCTGCSSATPPPRPGAPNAVEAHRAGSCPPVAHLPGEGRPQAHRPSPYVSLGGAATSVSTSREGSEGAAHFPSITQHVTDGEEWSPSGQDPHDRVP